MTGLLLLAAAVGMFEGNGDVGTVLHAGSAEYDSAARTYTVAGSGENMWFAADAFHFAWKKVTGDVTLTADVRILGEGGDPHRKAVLMIRQSLDADSAYADAAVHGDGLTSLQTRDAKGAATHEIQASVTGPARVRISKRGEWFYMSVTGEGGELRPAGGWMKASIDGTFYVGIGVCAHNKDAVERAVFSNVELGDRGVKRARYWSTLETVTVASTDRRAVFTTEGNVGAPTWSADGAALVFVERKRMWRVAATGGQPEPIKIGSGFVCSGYAGFSPDGKTLAFTARHGSHSAAQVWVVPAAGGKPRRMTKQGRSTWSGWSPDGKTLIFSGERKDRWGIFTMPASGGRDEAVIPYDGRDAVFSPDQRYIYFDSGRGGGMAPQVWRARADGSDKEQVTAAGTANWSPHVSPDGKWLAFLSHSGSGAGVLVQVMSLADGEIRVMGNLAAGGGSMDAPCWSPDSRRLAFVSFQRF
jgi:Tol biopolymer transport system component